MRGAVEGGTGYQLPSPSSTLLIPWHTRPLDRILVTSPASGGRPAHLSRDRSVSAVG
jgi:hypothetical protein